MAPPVVVEIVDLQFRGASVEQHQMLAVYLVDVLVELWVRIVVVLRLKYVVMACQLSVQQEG